MLERSFGSFNRSFPVPDGVDADKTGASFKKGVVSMPKAQNAQKAEKQIEVKAG